MQMVQPARQEGCWAADGGERAVGGSGGSGATETSDKDERDERPESSDGGGDRGNGEAGRGGKGGDEGADEGWAGEGSSFSAAAAAGPGRPRPSTRRHAGTRLLAAGTSQAASGSYEMTGICLSAVISIPLPTGRPSRRADRRARKLSHAAPAMARARTPATVATVFKPFHAIVKALKYH
jgi:hypothetical protein